MPIFTVPYLAWFSCPPFFTRWRAVSWLILGSTVSGCIPASAYHAHEAGGDSFAMNDKYLRVDPYDYPVFAFKENRQTPMGDSRREWLAERFPHPELLKQHRWEITHAFNGRYLAYSKEYDWQYCVRKRAIAGLPPRFCGESYNGYDHNVYLYVRRNGDAYGFQYLRNPKRWLLPSDKASWFRVVDYGDWSEQPWLECVDRCEKVVNMK